MAKIVIIAPSDVDVTDAVKLLKGAGNDVDVEQPEAKALLHVILGLFGANAYGFGSAYVIPPPGGGMMSGSDLPPPADDEEAIENETTDDGTTDDLDNQDDIDMPEAGAEDDFNFEGVTIDGEPIAASKTNLDHSVLVVEKMVPGPKTTYMINESTFSFWPANALEPKQRVDVETKKGYTSLEVVVTNGAKQELQVGKDLYKMFEGKKRE